MTALLVGSSPDGLSGQALVTLAAECSLAIGVDGGADVLIAAGISVDLVIGDMDSLGSAGREAITGGHVKSIRHPRDKDESDLEIALGWCRDNAVDEVVCTGVTGGRLDHTLAALGSLARHGSLRPVIHESSSIAWVLSCDGRRSIDVASLGATVSVIALEDDSRLEASGLKWTLPASLKCLWDRGLSNEVSAVDAQVTITQGVALVVVNTPIA